MSHVVLQCPADGRTRGLAGGSIMAGEAVVVGLI